MLDETSIGLRILNLSLFGVGPCFFQKLLSHLNPFEISFISVFIAFVVFHKYFALAPSRLRICSSAVKSLLVAGLCPASCAQGR
eukprot:s1653_g7.t1